MELRGRTVLVTGGATGIGLAIAERFLKAGSEVNICGRREDILRQARELYPEIHTHVCDLSEASERVALHEWAIGTFPGLDVLVNNAGIQQRLQLTEPQDWTRIHQEIAINLDAHIHLALLFVPHLRTRQDAAIMNVTSGLAFAPLASVPVYCATKAAMHSFTQSLRTQLAKTSIRVVELIPPAVDTDLGGPGLHKFGVSLKEFADAAFVQLATDDDREISYGFSAESSQASRQQLDAMFDRMNAPTGAP